MTAIEKILTTAEAMRVATGLDEKRLSGRVFNDRAKLFALRNGADLTTGRFESAMKWFSDNWPENVPWPENVERPTPSIVEVQP